MKGWHFLQDDRRLRWGTRSIVKTGKTYTCKGEILMCCNGMHASKRIQDALGYAPGQIICRVELTGELQHDNDKSVGRKRKVLCMLDATNILHEFACRYAEDAIELIKKPDPRTIAAIEAKRKWMRGEITNKELDAARYAASSAASSAARSAQNKRLTAMVCAAHRKESA